MQSKLDKKKVNCVEITLSNAEKVTWNMSCEAPQFGRDVLVIDETTLYIDYHYNHCYLLQPVWSSVL